MDKRSLIQSVFFCSSRSGYSLEFEGGDPTSDEDVDLKLPNIVVATVDEPSGFAFLATGLVLLAGALSRFRRPAGRGYRWQRRLPSPGR